MKVSGIVGLVVAASLLVMGGCASEPRDDGDTFDAGAALDGSASDTGVGEPALDISVDATEDVAATSDTAPEDGLTTDVPDDVPGPPAITCESQGLPVATMDHAGPFGTQRHALAEDFTFYPMIGEPWTLSEHWTGCDTYVFVPNARAISDLDPLSIWTKDIDTLVWASPKNVHYFFVVTTAPNGAMAALENMQIQVETFLASLSAHEADYWRQRLHVAGGHTNNFPGWLKSMLSGNAAYYGFGIDRAQKIRHLGSFADVTRYSQALSAQDKWPWENNMAYAAHEVRWYNAIALRQAALDAEENLTIISAWSGEVLKFWVEKEVEFPDAATMATFDSLTIDLTMDCEDPNKEFGSCGSWDYLAHIKLREEGEEGGLIELARFITTYHREGRYVVDATPMLHFLRQGGKRTIRFDISPEWNQQAYLTQMDFRFRTNSKEVSPSQVTDLFGGGGFNADYNGKYQPMDVEIPASASRVEVWAIITGHGMDTDNCAEFCDHHHAFTVNGTTVTKTHPDVGNQVGCITQIESGMTPNQGGTWWFGRGGWCPGQHVKPFVADVTDAVVPGEAATIDYQGLYKGGTPDGNYGNIHMSSFLVVYE